MSSRWRQRYSKERCVSRISLTATGIYLPGCEGIAVRAAFIRLPASPIVSVASVARDRAGRTAADRRIPAGLIRASEGKLGRKEDHMSSPSAIQASGGREEVLAPGHGITTGYPGACSSEPDADKYLAIPVSRRRTPATATPSPLPNPSNVVTAPCSMLLAGLAAARWRCSCWLCWRGVSRAADRG
jgi:hypothetical protein